MENLILYKCPYCGHAQNDQNQDLFGGFCNQQAFEAPSEHEFSCPKCGQSFIDEPEQVKPKIS